MFLTYLFYYIGVKAKLDVLHLLITHLETHVMEQKNLLKSNTNVFKANWLKNKTGQNKDKENTIQTFIWARLIRMKLDELGGQ